MRERSVGEREPLVEIAGMSRRFGHLAAVDDLSLTISRGEWVAITGPSGSGKTTLLNILAGLDRPTSGSVVVDGVDLATLSRREIAAYRRGSVGLVFQQFHLVPYLTAIENVMLAQYVHSMADRAEAKDALERVGLGARLDHLPSQLSGGEQQRVSIARALINQPPLILADEPTGNLDAVNEAVVLRLLSDLHQRGHTLVLVTHAPAIAARAEREVRLEHGRLARHDETAAPLASLLVDLWVAIEEDQQPISVARRGIAELLGDGHLTFEGQTREGHSRLAFTESGRREAIAAVRRVRLAEALLARTLSEGESECGKERPIAAGFEDQVDAFLDHPTICPHGRPIPKLEGQAELDRQIPLELPAKERVR
jgi:putative ABC transport system ATP-binding protein